jgi:hypothetical protein
MCELLIAATYFSSSLLSIYEATFHGRPVAKEQECRQWYLGIYVAYLIAQGILPC